MKIGVIDYRAGNLRSVINALKAVGCDGGMVVKSPGELERYDKIILPGVGAFPKAMAYLNETGFVQALNEQVVGRGKLFLGVCLGMQLVLEMGHEGEKTPGLGWLRGAVTRFADTPGLSVPHVGWNDTRPVNSKAIMAGVPEGADFYYVHSFKVACSDSSDVAATCEYGEPFVAAVERGNVFGTQFHPEKSQHFGLRVLKNFVELPC